MHTIAKTSTFRASPVKCWSTPRAKAVPLRGSIWPHPMVTMFSQAKARDFTNGLADRDSADPSMSFAAASVTHAQSATVHTYANTQ